MPTLDIEGDLDLPKYFATILYPNNADEESRPREELEFVLTMNQVSKMDNGDNEFFEISRDVLTKLLNSRPLDVVYKDTKIRRNRAILAGLQLLYVYVMKTMGVDRPSLSKARDIVESVLKGDDYHLKALFEKDKWRTSDLITTWTTFKNVAHIWAAYIYIGSADPLNMGFSCCNSDHTTAIYYGIAERFREFGESFKEQRASESLLNASEIWKPCAGHNFPAVFDLPAKFSAEITDPVAKLVDKYIAEKKWDN